MIFLHDYNDLYLFSFFLLLFLSRFFFIRISSILLFPSLPLFLLPSFFSISSLLSWYFIFTTNIDRKREQKNGGWHKGKEKKTLEKRSNLSSSVYGIRLINRRGSSRLIHTSLSKKSNPRNYRELSISLHSVNQQGNDLSSYVAVI